MSLAGKLKGMLSVGGVRITITEVENPVNLEGASLSGKYELSTPCAMVVNCVTARLVRHERVEDDYGFETIDTTTIAEFTHEGHGPGDFPLQLLPGEPQERKFTLANLEFTPTSPTTWYLVEVSAQVRGMTSNPSDRRPIEVVVAKS